MDGHFKFMIYNNYYVAGCRSKSGEQVPLMIDRYIVHAWTMLYKVTPCMCFTLRTKESLVIIYILQHKIKALKCKTLGAVFATVYI